QRATARYPGTGSVNGTYCGDICIRLPPRAVPTGSIRRNTHFHGCTEQPILRRASKGGGMQDKAVYLTAEGKHRFTAELHELVTVRRHEVEEQIRRAKEFSDTVDNAEYE